MELASNHSAVFEVFIVARFKCKKKGLLHFLSETLPYKSFLEL